MAIAFGALIQYSGKRNGEAHVASVGPRAYGPLDRSANVDDPWAFDRPSRRCHRRHRDYLCRAASEDPNVVHPYRGRRLAPCLIPLAT